MSEAVFPARDEDIQVLGEAEGLAEEQIEAVVELRGLLDAKFTEGAVAEDAQPLTLRDYNFCDYTCLRRYLRAWRFDVAAALKGLLETLAWRKEARVDSIRERLDLVRSETASGKMFSGGVDREGRPLLFMYPAREDTSSRTHDGSIVNLIYHLERTISRMSRGHEKMVLLIHFRDYSVFNAPPFKTSLETLHILSRHYPERLYRAYLFSPPWAFSIFWKAISPFIDVVTKEKIVLLKGNEQNRRERVAEEIDLGQLGVQFEGDNEDMDVLTDEQLERYFDHDRKCEAMELLLYAMRREPLAESFRAQPHFAPQALRHVFEFL